jgi:hypothetical protein
VQTKLRRTANNVLVLTMPAGKWTAQEARASASLCQQLMDRHSRYVLVADVTVMTDYDSEARVTWTSLLRERRAQLLAIWLVAPTVHPVVRMGAATAAMVLQMKFRFARSLEEVPELAGDASGPAR